MISIKNLTKMYGDKTIYSNFNLDIPERQILVILGESGSGKTTLLNVLANITDYEGEITGNITPVSMVFQKDYLVPNLTVEENLKLVCNEKDALCGLEYAGLLNSAKSYPKSLSAGMSRRVALLRGVLADASLLLMDEPTSSLDIKWKMAMDKFIHCNKNDKTIVVVTHDIEEALALADTVMVLRNGRIVYSYYFNSVPFTRDITGKECNEIREELIRRLI